jgi:hypothetical protein
VHALVADIQGSLLTGAVRLSGRVSAVR